MKTITVAGTGFVGLVTAAVFADKGFPTIALDIDEEKINSVNKGKPFFFEPHLAQLLERVVLGKKTLKASSAIIDSIVKSDFTFICVGTPSRKDGSCDLSQIKMIANDIGVALQQMKKYHVVVAKSTIEPGTTRKVINSLIEKQSLKKAGKDYGLCMSPEFLREGRSVYDTLYPDRVIIGEYDTCSGKMLEELYNNLYTNRQDAFVNHWEKIFEQKISCPPIKRYSLESAECIKYANNSFLATKISFINEFANICEQLEEVDVTDIAEGIGLDARIAPHFLRAGAGFGGSCFPKDVNAIIHFAQQKGYTPLLLSAVLEINARQAKHMVELLENKIGSLKGKKIAVLGLAFKPGTDDMRNAPSIIIINNLLLKKAKVIAFDPEAMQKAQNHPSLGNKITFGQSILDALTDADGCLLVTEWDAFKNLQPRDFKVMKKPVVIDGRRIYDPQKFLKEGIDYAGIGLGLFRNNCENSSQGVEKNA